MKTYLGDINDYRKYIALRTIVRTTQYRMGVCLLRSMVEQKAPGGIHAYLKLPQKYERFDPELFATLSRHVLPGGVGSLGDLTSWHLLRDAEYFFGSPPIAAEERKEYFDRLNGVVKDCPVIYLEPEYGIEVKTNPKGRMKSVKYVYWDELESLMQDGRSLIILQQFHRIAKDEHIASLKEQMCRRLSVEQVIAIQFPHAVLLIAAQRAHSAGLAAGCHNLENIWEGEIMVEY